ncbi:MAG: hypothetical protein HRU33_15695 [Rhodobacteraceae bacterium]|nr:hypothetical protein [Paracoccaceae bacterium]
MSLRRSNQYGWFENVSIGEYALATAGDRG